MIMMNYISLAFDLFFPISCPVCGENKPSLGKYFCDQCVKDLILLECPLCFRCGGVLKNQLNVCLLCQESEWFFERAFALFRYNQSMSKVIQHIKYHEMTYLIKFFKNYLVDFISRCDFGGKIDILTSIPLHPVKKKERGFNQSHLFCLLLKDILKIPYLPKLLKRVKNTASQASLKRDVRKDNLKYAFKADKRYDLTNKNILLFDDVFTSGSTVNEASRAIKDLNSENVFVLTLARA